MIINLITYLLVMYLVYKIREKLGFAQYTSDSCVGIFEDIKVAKETLVRYLDSNKYSYIYCSDLEDYVYVMCIDKNGIEVNEKNILCFEIKQSNIREINKIYC